MAYKISDTAIIVNEGGEKVLIAEELQYEDSITISSTTNTLSPSYITDYFTFPPNHAQGSTSGYNSGGFLPPTTNVIEKFPFASDANSTDVGDLTLTRRHVDGQSSTANGYSTGGIGSPGYVDIIDKFPFSVDANATDVGDLTEARGNKKATNSSTVSGYTCGGFIPPDNISNIIDKFPFASDANATDVGDLSEGGQDAAGQSSGTHGYVSGGIITSPTIVTSRIEKFPFSTDTNATLVSQLSIKREQAAGTNSNTHGYTSGGWTPEQSPSYTTSIEKFPFSSNTGARDVGDLTQARAQVAGQSSTKNGYSSGGVFSPPTARVNTIDKFPFATDANATDVGDLLAVKSMQAGQQV